MLALNIPELKNFMKKSFLKGASIFLASVLTVGTDIIRAHKKYMINYRYISRINQSTNDVIMKAGETLKLGRSYKDTFMKGYMQYRHNRQTYE